METEARETSNAETLLDGVIVTGIGMGVVFVVLIALMIASSTMSWLDASESVRRLALRLSRSAGSGGEMALPSGGSRSAVAKPSLVSSPGPTGEEVAAIALAIALGSAPERERTLAAPLAEREPAATGGLSGWAAAGRRRAMERAPRFSR